MAKRFFENIYNDRQENISIKSLKIKDNINNLVECISKNASLSSKNTLYTGTTGIAFMFYRLATSNEYKNDSKIFLNQAIEILKLKKNNFDQKKLGQFICGDAGINAVNAAIYHQIGNETMTKIYLENFVKGESTCKPIGPLKPGEDELFVGRAGYLYGVLWLEKELGNKIISNVDVFELCSTIVESGRKYSKISKSVFPLMYSYHNKEYLGAAHGLCTILQILISFPQFIEKDHQAKQDIKKCIDLLMLLQTANGNFPTKIVTRRSQQRPEEDELVHWCHGAPGVVYLFAKAYLVFKEHSYLECCLKCGDLVWTKGLLKKGPGLCHGIAGNGYVFLLLYRLTADKKHLDRAIKFGKFLFTDECIQGSRKPDNPYSLYEGLAGTVCYLNDLTQPEKASFPFLNVF